MIAQLEVPNNEPVKPFNEFTDPVNWVSPITLNSGKADPDITTAPVIKTSCLRGLIKDAVKALDADIALCANDALVDDAAYEALVAVLA